MPEVDQNSTQIPDFLQIIREIKDNPNCAQKYSQIINKESELMSLENIIDEMENINEFVLKFNENLKKTTIKEHLAYTIERSKSFKDIKYENIFQINVSKPHVLNNRKSNISKLMDYGVRDKLVGFVSKKGVFGWSEEKINDFIRSIINKDKE